MPKTIVANWKMNGTQAFAAEYVRGLLQFLGGLRGVKSTLVVCPPSVFLGQLAQALAASGVQTGGQDAGVQPAGAYTGEISAVMLKDVGAGYVILGHSERRRHYGETNTQVRAKVEAALAAGLTPIVCVGEPFEVRNAGGAEAFVAEQLKASLPGAASASFLIAYEPVWAIGSGRTPTVAEIVAMHRAIRTAAPAVSVLYGGSVNASNAKEILAAEGVDGVLVGGASLKLEEFCAIVSAAEAF